jgi:hypothetical protein
MRRLLAFVTLAVALPASNALVAAEARPLTKITARAMPQAALTRRLFGDLGQIMLPAFDRGSPGHRPTRPLGSLEFLTVPIATATPGLCETSSVTVHFEPDGPLAGADTPVHPTRIETTILYAIEDFAALRRGDDLSRSGGERLALDCADLDPRQATTIRADGGEMLAANLRILGDQLEAARAGHPHASLVCPGPDDMPQVSASDCLSSFAQLDPRHIWTVSRCQVPPAGVAGCVDMGVDGMSLRFESASIIAAPSRIVIEPIIVVADERID